jgi:hypothetical protein
MSVFRYMPIQSQCFPTFLTSLHTSIRDSEVNQIEADTLQENFETLNQPRILQIQKRQIGDTLMHRGLLVEQHWF